MPTAVTLTKNEHRVLLAWRAIRRAWWRFRTRAAKLPERLLAGGGTFGYRDRHFR